MVGCHQGDIHEVVELSPQGHELIAGVQNGLAAELTHGADQRGLHEADLLPGMAETVGCHLLLMGRGRVVSCTFYNVCDENLIGLYFNGLEHLAKEGFFSLLHGAGRVA